MNVFFIGRVQNLLVVILALAIAGCAAERAKRSEYGALPQLEKDWSRIYFRTGVVNDGTSTGRLGNKNILYIGDTKAGYAVRKQYIVLDIEPNKYEMFCTYENPANDLVIEKVFIPLKPDEVRHLTCDVHIPGLNNAGAYFGAIGAIVGAVVQQNAQEEAGYTAKMFLSERKGNYIGKKLVEYKKLGEISRVEKKISPIKNESEKAEFTTQEKDNSNPNEKLSSPELKSTVNQPAPIHKPSKKVHPIAANKTLPASENSKATSTVRVRLKELKELHAEGLISDDEFASGRKKVLDDM